MRTWDTRPREVAHLLNPAFLGLLVEGLAGGYATRSDEPIPFTLPFLGVPLCLDPYPLARLPRLSSTSMLVWLSQNPEIRYLIPSRARDMRHLVRESVIFAERHGLVSVGDDGAITSFGGPTAYRRSKLFSEDMATMYAKAAIVGKWFGRSGGEATILSAWGVRP